MHKRKDEIVLIIERYPSRGRDVRIPSREPLPSYFSPGSYRVVFHLDGDDVRAIELHPEGVDPGAIPLDADELVDLIWIRFRPDEPIPPVYRVFEDAGVALVYPETPALRTLQEQRFDPPPRVRPSIWKKIARADIVHIAAIPFDDHRYLAEDAGRTKTEIIAAHMHSVVLRREMIAAADYLSVPIAIHYVTYGEVTELARRRGLEPALDHLPALLPELPELPGDYWLDRTETNAPPQKTRYPDARIVFPVTMAPFHRALDGIALLLTDEAGYIRKTYVAYPTRVFREPDEYNDLIRKLLARTPDRKQLVLGDPHEMGLSEEGMYIFRPVLDAPVGEAD